MKKLIIFFCLMLSSFTANAGWYPQFYTTEENGITYKIFGGLNINEPGEINGSWHYFGPSCAEVIGNNNSEDIVIPEKIVFSWVDYREDTDGYVEYHMSKEVEVRYISSNAFSGYGNLTSITIPKTIKSCGEFYLDEYGYYSYKETYCSFEGCSSLTSIEIDENNDSYEVRGNCIVKKATNELFSCYKSGTISSSITSICSKAFYKLAGLTSVILPESIQNIKSQAFYECSDLTSVQVLGSPNVNNIFYQCQNLNYVDFCGNAVPDGFCDGQKSLTNITIRESINSIGNSAFSGCSALTSVVIPSNVNTIGSRAFSGCNGLTYMSIPNSLTTIGASAFSGCSSLTSMTIPNCLTRIEDMVFSGCSGLTMVTIPNSVTVIGNSVFRGCSALTSVTIPNSVTNIGKNAFENCSSMASVTIPNGVTKIEDRVFYGCSSLESVTISPCVTFIGSSAFEGCNINNVIVPVIDFSLFCENKALGCIYSSIGKPVQLIDNKGNEIIECVLPDGVTTIGSSAFRNCSGLASMTIPNSLTSIGNSAFEGCSGFTDVYCYTGSIPSSYTNSFSSKENINLHIHDYLIDDFKTSWPGFKAYIGLDNTDFKLTYCIDGEVYKSYYYKYGELITPEVEPTRTGYTFSGWIDIPETMPSRDVVVNGTFIVNSYKLTYIVDGNEYRSFYVEYGMSITPISSPTKEGHTFSGWSEIPENMPAHDVTVTGTFIINNYNLTYIVDGEVYKSYIIEYDAAITPEEEPTRKGYTFSGWNGIPAKMPSRDVVVTGSFSFSTLSIDNIVYQVTDGEMELAAVIGNDNATGEIIISESVEIDGYSYRVTAIKSRSFYGCKNITSIEIPQYVTEIGERAFAGIDILMDVTCYSEVIPTTDRTAFENSYIDYVTLRVPSSAVNAYRSTAPWSGFKEIIPISETEHDVYNLTYLVDGEVYKTYEMEEGAPITPEPEPSKEGFLFSGWSEIPETMPAHDVMITGSFSIIDVGTAEIEGIYYNLISETKVAVVVSNPNKYSGNVVIPKTVAYGGQVYDVTTISGGAFYQCINLTSVAIPNSVTTIGDGAFQECLTLTSVTIPNSVITIGNEAFAYCPNLTSVIILNGVTTIGNKAFYYCTGLASMTIPNSIRNIGDEAFYMCTNLNSVTIPNSVNNIGVLSFAYCYGLTTMTIQEGITTIGDRAFYNCGGLISVTIPNSVIKIGDASFINCSSLKNLTIGSGIEIISSQAFAECPSLEEVYCYAEDVPNTNLAAFENSSIDNAILRVPSTAVTAYYTTAPWSNFKKIIPISESGHDVYNLTYLVDGEVYKTYEMEEGAIITPEPAPTKEGYTFSGWSWIPETMPPHDVIVTGSFERIYNVGDVVNVVNYIMDGYVDAAAISLYDMNHDGELNIGDIILIIRYILSNPAYGRSLVGESDEWMTALAHSTAVQFEIEIPNGITVNDIRLVKDMESSHQVTYKQTGTNTFAVVVWSLSNQLLQTENGSIVEVVADGHDMTDFTAQNVTFAMPSGETLSYAGLPIATSIKLPKGRTNTAVIYDMKGCRIYDTKGLKQGLYIIDGKKRVVR